MDGHPIQTAGFDLVILSAAIRKTWLSAVLPDKSVLITMTRKISLSGHLFKVSL